MPNEEHIKKPNTCIMYLKWMFIFLKIFLKFSRVCKTRTKTVILTHEIYRFLTTFVYLEIEAITRQFAPTFLCENVFWIELINTFRSELAIVLTVVTWWVNAVRPWPIQTAAEHKWTIFQEKDPKIQTFRKYKDKVRRIWQFVLCSESLKINIMKILKLSWGKKIVECYTCPQGMRASCSG